MAQAAAAAKTECDEHEAVLQSVRVELETSESSRAHWETACAK